MLPLLFFLFIAYKYVFKAYKHLFKGYKHVFKACEQTYQEDKTKNLLPI